jgi:hypothetical protein
MALIACTCTEARDLVLKVHHEQCTRILTALLSQPNFEAGYQPELVKLASVLPPLYYTELAELLSDAHESFYTWALLRLALIVHTMPVSTILSYDCSTELLDTLFPLLEDEDESDWSEADAAIAEFVETTDIMRYIPRGCYAVDWVFRPSAFATKYNYRIEEQMRARGLAPKRRRLTLELLGSQ